MTFNLSERIRTAAAGSQWQVIGAEDVKEFIRLLKEEAEKDTFEWGDESCDGEWHTGYDKDELIRFIDKLAGDKLK
jgi:hypothetical protein